jgi:hypothetical protein
MKTFTIQIDYSKINSHNDLVGQLSSLLNLNKLDDVEVEIDLNAIPEINPDYFSLVYSVIVNLIEQGVTVHHKTKHFDNHSFMFSHINKIDLSSEIGLNYLESIKTQISMDCLFEIKQFSDPMGALNLHKEIMKMLMGSGVKDEVLSILEFCLWELIDNTLNHSVEGDSLGLGKGIVSVQFYPEKEIIRFLIADHGCGIYKALTKHPDSAYLHYTEAEALLNCVKKGVTNGTGAGFGLWAVAKFVESNKGYLSIHSGGKQLQINQVAKVSDAFRWYGTYVLLEINTDKLVDPNVIFGNDHTDFYRELKDELFENLIDLW